MYFKQNGLFLFGDLQVLEKAPGSRYCQKTENEITLM